MKYVVIVCAVLVALVLATFGIQNTEPVSVRFFGLLTSGVPLYIVIALSTLIGMLLVGLLNIPGRIQRGLETRRLRQQLTQLEQQVVELKDRLPRPVMQPLPEDKRVKS